MNLLSSIKKLDLYSYNLKIKIEGNDNYRTVLGGIISILLFVSYLTGMIYFGKELWEKKHPVVIISANDYPIPDKIQLKEDFFNLYIGVQGPDFEFIDETIFVYEAFEINQILNKKTKLEMGRCISTINQ